MNTLLTVLASRLVFTLSDAQPTLFTDLVRIVFVAVSVINLIMVGSISQLYDVVGEMNQHFAMQVTPLLPDSSTQTYVVRDTCPRMIPSGSSRRHDVWKAC